MYTETTSATEKYASLRFHLFSKIQTLQGNLFLLYFASRILLLALAFVVYHPNFQLDTDMQNGLTPSIKELWEHFDALWYRKIAVEGYEHIPYSIEKTRGWGFSPLYPMILKAFIWPFSNRGFFYIASLFSSVCTLAALTLLVSVFKGKVQNDRRFLFLYLISAGSFYLSIPYTESLALLLLALSFYFTQSKRYFLAAMMAGLGAITRVQLWALLVIPLIDCLQDPQIEKKFSKALKIGTLFSVPILAHMAYLYYLSGNPLAFFHIQEAWGNPHSYPLQSMVTFILNGRNNNPCQWLNFFLWSFFIACFLRNYRKIPLNEIVFCILVFLISTGCEKFYGAYRYVLLLTPLYIVLTNEKEWFRNVYIYSNLILGTIYIIAFVNNNCFAI